MIHSGGVGTPLEHMATDPMEACVICHMPEGEHLFRINVDADYSTRPMPAALTGTVNANAAADGNYPSAVWVDLDGACGKCHGGGLEHVETTGSVYQVLGRGSDQQQHQLRRSGWHLVADHQVHGPGCELRGLRPGIRQWSSTISLCTLTAGKYLRRSRSGRRRHDGRAADRSGGSWFASTTTTTGQTKLNDDFETYIASNDA